MSHLLMRFLYLGLMKFFIKFGGPIDESTQDTTAVAFPMMPV